MTNNTTKINELFTENYNSQILFEQYKLYVEMANNVSNRRENTNKFYVSLISLLITIIVIINSLTQELQILIFPITTLIPICYLWMKNIESYSTLNKGKFSVINEIENKLPAKGFTIECDLMTLYNYKELTKVEKKVPTIIIGLAIVSIILIILIQKGSGIF